MPDFSDLKLGDVILVPFPNSDLSTTKIRPAVIVQADNIDSEIPQFIVAMLSSNLRRAGRASRVLIRKGSKLWQESGLLVDSVVLGDKISTIRRERIIRKVGFLWDMNEVDRASRHSLNL